MRITQRWTGTGWEDTPIEDFPLGVNYVKIVEVKDGGPEFLDGDRKDGGDTQEKIIRLRVVR